MEALLQKRPITVSNSETNKGEPAKQFGKHFLDSMEFDFTKFSSKRRRSVTKPKLPCSHFCSETEIASPKMSVWDICTKHDKFAKRKLQMRSKSGLCNESVDQKDFEHFPQVISVKPLEEKDTTGKGDSGRLLIKSIKATSDDETNKVQLTSNEAQITTKKQLIVYDSYDDEQPDVVVATVTPKRLNFSESEDSSSDENQQPFSKSTREKRSTDDNNNIYKSGHNRNEVDSPVQPVKKIKLDEKMMFRINRTKHVPIQTKNKKRKETKRENRRMRG